MGYLRFLIDNRLFLLAGFLLTFTSSYGQTYFISLFAGEIKTTFGLTDGGWGGLYTVATTLAAVAMVWVGALTDRFRVRALSLFTMLALAAACLSMAVVPNALLLVAVIFALRLTGQGMMSQLGAVAMARWFVATRGQALSLSSMGFSLGQAILPILFVSLFAVIHWRMLWVLAAALVLIVIPVMQILLRQERTPQSIAADDQVAGMKGKHWTRLDLLRSPLFWLVVPIIMGPSAWGTALFFHQVHLVEVKGWSMIAYVSMFPAYTLSAIIFTFASGWAVDRFGAKWVVPFQMLPFAVCFAILAIADTIWMAGLGLIVFGAGQGLQSTATSAFWAEFYGTRHLGSIKAAAAAIMVFGSAIGPGITGLMIDWGVDFTQQMVPISAYYFIAGLAAAFGIWRYQRDLPVTT